MYEKSLSTKENIMLAFVKLLNNKEIEQIAISNIANEAKVAVGLINYHFKTKENLFNLAIEYYIQETIKEESKSIVAQELEPKEQLITSLKGFANFFVKNKKMSRLYLINCLTRMESDSMANLGYEYYIPILKKILKDKSEIDLIFIIYPIISAIQMMFLNNETLKKVTNLDYFLEKDRHFMIMQLIENGLKLK